MSTPLPLTLDPWKAVYTGAVFVGGLTLAELPRLAEAVIGAGEQGHYSLRFEQDPEGQAVARGRVTLVVKLNCQRCLGEMSYALDAPIGWALVRSVDGFDGADCDDVQGLPDRLEPLPVGEGDIHPLELIEDELLLALPLVPVHEGGACQAELAVDAIGDAFGVTDTRQNPFAILASLKANG